MVIAVSEQDIRTDDWSEAVSPFWGAVIKSALSRQGFAGLFKAGWTTIKVRHSQTQPYTLYPILPPTKAAHTSTMIAHTIAGLALP